MVRSLTILIVGGYGIFGGRIVELLENEPRLTLIVAGRSRSKAQAYCDGRKAAKAQTRAGRVRPRRRSGRATRGTPAGSSRRCQRSIPGLWRRRYRLIEACIGQRINYLDLADGSEFVAGVSAFDAAARKAGVFVLSGVSSFPVLTAAVVRHLSAAWRSVDAIRGGIAPSPFAGVGENVIRAIAGYAGQPVRTATRRRAAAAIRSPSRCATRSRRGGMPLRNTLFSLVDVPDLRALASSGRMRKRSGWAPGRCRKSCTAPDRARMAGARAVVRRCRRSRR